MAKRANGIAQILPKIFHPQNALRLVEPFAGLGNISELAPGSASGVSGAQTFLAEAVCFDSYMRFDLGGEVALLPASEKHGLNHTLGRHLTRV
jgi:hypothetical protein